MKLQSQSMIMHFTEDVTVGDLSATLVALVHVNSVSDTNPDIEFADIININFRGVEVNGWQNWKKFKEFHMGMGINYDEIINAEFDKIFNTKSICRELGHGG